VHELAIEARGLTKRFGKTVALEHLDLTVGADESVALLGAGGAGKSTVLRLLAGLARPSGGRVTVSGVAPASRAGLGARQRLGMLAQEPVFYGWMTGRELLAFVADLLGIERREARDRIVGTLERVGLAAVADRQIGAYSLPERQRLGVGQALIGEPEILLLDEPFGWLDSAGTSEVLALIDQLRGSTSIVIATADVALAEGACDRIVVLDAGQVLATASTKDLLARLGPRDYVIEMAPGSGLALAGLLARLSSEPWVRAVASSEGTLRVAVRDEWRADHELLPSVVATGLTVLGLRRERPGVDVLLDRLRGEAT
jgi:ABC-type multidrug transport system ATPase subunit